MEGPFLCMLIKHVCPFRMMDTLPQLVVEET